MNPELHEVIKAYDEQIHLQKTLMHICCEIGAVNTAKLIIERIIEGVIKYKDALDDCLSREGLLTDCTRVEALSEYLNRKDSYGIAPIHLASHSGNIQMIKLLCANECDPY
jgi:ankyrin repeat protein